MKKITILFLMLALGLIGCGKEELTVDESKFQSYANKEALVSVHEAKKLIESDENIVVLDTQSGAKYKLGHITGAQHMFRDAMGAESGEYDFGGMRADREKLAKELGERGIDNNTRILIYDNSADYDAARLWWLLDMYGYDNVSLIDGGLEAWKRADYDTSLGGADKVEAKTFVFEGEPNYNKLATLEDVKLAMDNTTIALLDTRTQEENKGETTKKGAFRPGKIPNSIFLPWETAVNYDDDKTFKTKEELEAIYGAYSEKEIIAYCQSGVRSAHTTFVLSELLGYENIKNYDGSWIEWSYNEDLEAVVTK